MSQGRIIFPPLQRASVAPVCYPPLCPHSPYIIFVCFWFSILFSHSCFHSCFLKIFILERSKVDRIFFDTTLQRIRIKLFKGRDSWWPVAESERSFLNFEINWEPVCIYKNGESIETFQHLPVRLFWATHLKNFKASRNFLHLYSANAVLLEKSMRSTRSLHVPDLVSRCKLSRPVTVQPINA